MDINYLLEKIQCYLNDKGFTIKKSPGLLQPKFNYVFAPSGGHHVIDEIVIGKTEPHLPILKFQVAPTDRSIRMYDYDTVGISSRHLSFFEVIVFGYAGAKEELPKDEATEILFNLMTEVLELNKENILITTLGSVTAEGSVINEDEDQIFYETWSRLLGEQKVLKTNGRRNLFYSRNIGNPGGTGCEIYYKMTNGEYIEIGSQVNYKFKFTGGLEKMRNQAILQGFGLERLLMALQQKNHVCDTYYLEEIKQVLSDLFTKDVSIFLYKEKLDIIADHIRAISFIIYDGQEFDGSARAKLLIKFIKHMHEQFVYLGIADQETFVTAIKNMVNVITEIYKERYSISGCKEKIVAAVKKVIEN